MYIALFFICYSASTVGAICGIGGGVIIKPVIDAFGIMDAGTASFLSGCTVLSMAVISVGKSLKRKNVVIDLKRGNYLAAGAAVGGVAGKQIFQYIYLIYPEEKVAAVQSITLALVTAGTLIYTLCSAKVRRYDIQNIGLCVVTGLILGTLSAFLGIGGGPINLVVLTFLFSMNIKQAAGNSLYIIMFSQLASVVSTVLQRKVPPISPFLLGVMVVGGVAGAALGAKVNHRIAEKQVEKLFIAVMCVIIMISVKNCM